MVKNEKLQFECSECGSKELGYQKYVKCITPVSLNQNGHIEYGLPLLDEDDYLCADNTFICMNCKGFVEQCGCRMETEKELITYLTMDPKVRKQQKREYEELISAQMYDQEQRENEQVGNTKM